MNISAAHDTANFSSAETPPRRSASVLLLPLRLFLAAGWLRAAAEKVIDPDWWTGDALDRFLVEQRDEMLGFFVPFADHVVSPWSMPVAWLVVEVQVAIGLCLLLGRHVRPALWAGIVLNVAFVMAGRVDPSAFYLVMEMTLLFALTRRIDERTALRRAATWLVPAVLLVSSVSTIHPAEVIDDPALMLMFLCGLTAVTTLARSVQVVPGTRRTSAGIGPRGRGEDRGRRNLHQARQPAPRGPV